MVFITTLENGMRSKTFLRWLLGWGAILFILAISVIGPIDRTPLKDQPFYRAMMHRLDTLQLVQSAAGKLKADWAKVNITPSRSMPMAGYRPRNGFHSVHDSLYARIIALNNGQANVLLVTVDLLLFPPSLKSRLESKLRQYGLQHYFLYLAATHTHNGVGGWDESCVGYFVLGKYEDAWVEETAQKIVDGIRRLRPSHSTLQNWEADASEWVENRIAFEKGTKDGKLRGFTLEKENGKRAMFFSFSAHATSINKNSRALSGDYPAEVIRLIEQENDFGMYMAGMVGSHRIAWFPDPDFEFITKIGALLNQRLTERTTQASMDIVRISMKHIPIIFGASQMRIAKNWKIRDWVFRQLVSPLQGELTYLEIGNMVMIGTPCDFSGEIYVQEQLAQFAQERGKQLLITSFNGNYSGYITYDAHYDSFKKEELRALNWVGPYYGLYFAEMIKKLVSKQ